MEPPFFCVLAQPSVTTRQNAMPYLRNLYEVSFGKTNNRCFVSSGGGNHLVR